MKINYKGLAELGWRGTQTIRGLNAYHDWERLTPGERDNLALLWTAVPDAEKDRLEMMAIAICDAYQPAVLI